MNKKSPIAIFDSGIGGLTVAKKIHCLLPGEKIIYFGDTARVPYGTKSPETIRQYAIQIAGFLTRFDPKLIVIACHSVSSLGRKFLENRFSKYHFVDVIHPSIEEAINITKNKKIGVIGTPATIASGRYPEIIRKIDRKMCVYQASCPLLVPLVEEGWFKGDVTEAVLEYYISDLLKKKIDTLILGCTHYPMLKKTIQKIVGNSVNLVDASDATARKVKFFIIKNALSNSYKRKFPTLYFSDLPEYRKKIMNRFWKTDNFMIKKINIERSFNV
ncbi:MAG TPA: glutamate racemase [bacterium]|nr:glutamate racemase [bacterium]